MSKNDFLVIYKQNYEHIRHIENHRNIALSIYIPVAGTVLYLISKQSNFFLTQISLLILLAFTIFNFHSCIKNKEILDDYTKSLKDIILDELKIDKKYVGFLRKKSTLSISRLFEGFYILMIVIIIILMTAHPLIYCQSDIDSININISNSNIDFRPLYYPLISISFTITIVIIVSVHHTYKKCDEIKKYLDEKCDEMKKYLHNENQNED